MVIGLDVYWREGRSSFLSQSSLNLSTGDEKLATRSVIVLFIFAVGSSVIDDQVDWVFGDIVVRIRFIFIVIFTSPPFLHRVLAEHGALKTHTVWTEPLADAHLILLVFRREVALFVLVGWLVRKVLYDVVVRVRIAFGGVKSVLGELGRSLLQHHLGFCIFGTWIHHIDHIWLIYCLFLRGPLTIWATVMLLIRLLLCAALVYYDVWVL